MNQTTRPKAYSYLRFSTPEQMRGDSFRRQTTMAQEYAARHGLDLDTSLSFHDLGVSAFRGANAEAGRLADFREAVQVGLVPPGSFLLVEALDRLSRLVPRKAFRVLEEIVELGVSVVTLNDGKTYTPANLDADPMSLLTAIVVFMRANEESATKARRLRAAWHGKREKAADRPLTAMVPAWLTLNREIGEIELIVERVAIVRRIFDEYLSGRGGHAIADGLNTDAVPCFGRAVYWHRSYVKKIIENPAVHGVYVPHEYGYSAGKRTRAPLAPLQGYYPAAVTLETFEAAQALKGTATVPKGKAGKIVGLLAGLAICPACGASMGRINKGARSQPKLVCMRAKVGAGCSYRSVAVVSVEDALIQHTDQIIGEAPSGSPDLDAELAGLLTNIDAAEDAIGNLVGAIVLSPSAALSHRLADIEAHLLKDRQRADELLVQTTAAAGPVLKKRFRALADALKADPLARPQANASLRAVLSAVVVDYRRGELVMRWKHGGESAIHYTMPSEE